MRSRRPNVANPFAKSLEPDRSVNAVKRPPALPFPALPRNGHKPPCPVSIYRPSVFVAGQLSIMLMRTGLIGYVGDCDLGETLVSKEKIEELLRQLHNELAEADNVDAELSEKLRGTAAEIQTALQRQPSLPATIDEAPESESTGVIDQLRDAAERFEDSHPTLTNTVGRIADALSQLGI